MANTKALRKRIEQQIRALQEKLKAIEVVERLAEEVNLGQAVNHDSEPVPQVDGHSGDVTAGVTETIQDTAAKVLVDDWTRVQKYHEQVKAIHPEVRLAAVSTAMRRLVQRDLAEVRGSRKEGLEYRRRPGPAHQGRAPM